MLRRMLLVVHVDRVEVGLGTLRSLITVSVKNGDLALVVVVVVYSRNRIRSLVSLIQRANPSTFNSS